MATRPERRITYEAYLAEVSDPDLQSCGPDE
jgi:hypothetical protein